MATVQSRARKPKVNPAEGAGLIAALKFVSCAQRTDGLPYQSHCRIAQGKVLAFDGGIAACTDIDTQIEACPQTAMLIKALERCQSTIAVTLTDNGSLSIKSGKLKATIQCLPFEDLPDSEPDPICANINDKLKEALLIASSVCLDDSSETMTAGVMMMAGSVVATNRHVIIECWHGIDLPPGILIPKASVIALCKTDKVFKSFGFSANTATFYYEDGSYIKTCLFSSEHYPKFEHLLNVQSNPWPLPPGFYEAVETVRPFSDNDSIYFNKGIVSSHADGRKGATFEISGIPEAKCISGEYLKILKPFIKTIDFGNDAHKNILFFGDNLRGAIAPKHYVSGNPAPYVVTDDDVPF